MAFAMYRNWLVTRPYLTSAVTSALVLATGDAMAQSIEHRQYLTAHPTATPLTNPALSFQPNRTFILSLWGGAVFSPFFTRFFHFLDAQPSLKAKTARNISIRVVSIFLAAQPLNAFFFVYTSTLEYFLPVDRLGAAHVDATVAGPARKLLEARSTSPTTQSLDFSTTSAALSTASPASPSSFSVAYRAISQRATAQLIEKAPVVVVNAAIIWGPFNIVNQSIVPLQWRVVTGSFVSVLWNCWMSLVAHEEVAVKGEEVVGQAVVVA